MLVLEVQGSFSLFPSRKDSDLKVSQRAQGSLAKVENIGCNFKPFQMSPIERKFRGFESRKKKKNCFEAFKVKNSSKTSIQAFKVPGMNDPSPVFTFLESFLTAIVLKTQ